MDSLSYEDYRAEVAKQEQRDRDRWYGHDEHAGEPLWPAYVEDPLYDDMVALWTEAFATALFGPPPSTANLKSAMRQLGLLA